MGCKSDAYDPMEKAMIYYCEEQGIKKDHFLVENLLTNMPLLMK